MHTEFMKTLGRAMHCAETSWAGPNYTLSHTVGDYHRLPRMDLGASI